MFASVFVVDANNFLRIARTCADTKWHGCVYEIFAHTNFRVMNIRREYRHVHRPSFFFLNLSRMCSATLTYACNLVQIKVNSLLTDT